MELSPNGPKGPRESSTASKRVDCDPKRFGVREALPVEREPEVDGLYETVVDEVDAEAAICK